MLNPDLMSPCGLFCGACPIYVADRTDDQRLKEKLSAFYNVAIDEIACKGCLSDVPFSFCRVCEIKSCSADKQNAGCHECDDFPCALIENFPVPEGKAVILRSVPKRRQVGDEQWVKNETDRYTCPHCGGPLFRASSRCRSCKEPVDTAIEPST
jgi:hypothetical protein